jgi:hypothetical protein
MIERNAGVQADKLIALRVGIHQGDIIVEDGDIFGDGFNLGARLEALAEPGGICVSRVVRDDVPGGLKSLYHQSIDVNATLCSSPTETAAYGASVAGVPGLNASGFIVTAATCEINVTASYPYAGMILPVVTLTAGACYPTG